jgi:hypothetical protein
VGKLNNSNGKENRTMRNIIFRGKRTDNGEWVFGFPISFAATLTVEGIETWDGERHPVDESTVGEYTGLVDKNGTRIFEGDVVATATRTPHEVMFADGGFFMDGTAIPFKFATKFSIIGNIYDNPELKGE